MADGVVYKSGKWKAKLAGVKLANMNHNGVFGTVKCRVFSLFRSGGKLAEVSCVDFSGDQDDAVIRRIVNALEAYEEAGNDGGGLQ